MTEQKTTRARSTRAKTKVETAPVEQVDTQVVDQTTEEKTKPTKIEATTKQSIKESDKIAVMNNTTGRYGYIGRSGYSFELEEYGDIAYVPFSELREMLASRQKVHVTSAFIVILDTDAIEELNLQKLYETILDDNGVENLLTQPHKVKDILPKMPKIMRETVISIARRKFKSRELTNLAIADAIKDSVKIDIME